MDFHVNNYIELTSDYLEINTVISAFNQPHATFGCSHTAGSSAQLNLQWDLIMEGFCNLLPAVTGRPKNIFMGKGKEWQA